MDYYRRRPIEKLVGALLLDRAFRETFLPNPAHRLEVVAQYGESYRRRFGEKLIELTPAEQTLIVSLPTESLQAFCEKLEAILEQQVHLSPGSSLKKLPYQEQSGADKLSA